MFRSEEEKINIVIGQAILSLLEEDDDISAEKISEKLKQMLEAETDNDRRKIVNSAIRQTRRLVGRPVYSTNSVAQIKQHAGQILLGRGTHKKGLILRRH